MLDLLMRLIYIYLYILLTEYTESKNFCVFSYSKKPEIGHKRTQAIYVKCDKRLHSTFLSKRKWNYMYNILLFRNIFPLLEGYISKKYIENTYFLYNFWFFVRFQVGFSQYSCHGNIHFSIKIYEINFAFQKCIVVSSLDVYF